MEAITIRNNTYKFKEETYTLSQKDSFSISCAKFNFEGNFTNETPRSGAAHECVQRHEVARHMNACNATKWRGTRMRANNEEFNYDTLSKNLYFR